MRKFVFVAEAAGVLTAAVLGLPATAAANPDDQTADVVVNNLQSQGYPVKVVPPNSPLPQCHVTRQYPRNLDLSASLLEKQHTLVEVDVSCP
jgi:hypothetical protein